MKKTKIIVPALAMLVMSTAATVTGTVAWFSMNKTVTASGMRVKATAEGSLVIKNREKESPSLPNADLKATDFNFSESTATALYASTHIFDDGIDNYTTYPTGLKYITNADVINPETGTPLDTGNAFKPVYASAANTTGSGAKTFYKDYEVYIAGDGQSFTGKDIKVTLTNSNGSLAAVNKAVSIDFYVVEVTSAGTSAFAAGNYVDTLNVANVENDGTSSVAKSSFNITGKTVPQARNTGDTDPAPGALLVGMRVYYDGALIETGGASCTDYAQYKPAQASDIETGKYFYTSDHKVSLVAKADTEASEITGLEVVNKEVSVITYATSNEYTSLNDVQLKVAFELQ